MTTEPPSAPTGQRHAHRRMEPTRKIALAAGIAYLVTFAASIPQLKLFADVIADLAGYIQPGQQRGLAVGIGARVPDGRLRRRHRRSALPRYQARQPQCRDRLRHLCVVEAALILVGVVAILSVVTLQQHFAGATGAQAQALGVTGEALVAMRQWTFLLGPGVMAGVNDLLLGYILYRSGLVGRVIPIIGLVGGPLILLSDVATILGIWGQVSTARPPVRPPRRCLRVLRRRVPDRQGLPLRGARRPRRAVRLDPGGRGLGLTSDPLSPAARRPIAPGEGRLPDRGMVPDQRFQAATSYSLRSPPRIGRRRILPSPAREPTMLAAAAATAAPDAAARCCSARRTRQAPGAGAAHRRSASGRWPRSGRSTRNVRRSSAPADTAAGS